MPSLKILLVLFLPLYLYSQSVSLKTLIHYAGENNELIEAKQINIKSKQQEVEAAQSAYWPTLDIGASHSYVSPNSIVSPGQVSSAYAALSVDLYDGGKKDALLRGKDFELEASVFEKMAFEKSVTLEIVQHYYGIKKLKATLTALVERSLELKEQIKRVKKFISAELSTQEEVDKLQSAYDNNEYIIANNKLLLSTSEENLQLLSGLSAKHLKRNYFLEPKNIRFEVFDNSKILEANVKVLQEASHTIDAGYKPQVSLSDTFNKSHYDDTIIGGDNFLIDNQNKLMISVNMRIFDNGKMDRESEAVKYKKMALQSQIAYAKKEQKMNFRLSNKSLQTTRTKLKSANSALRAAKSTYSVLKQKFEAGLVDNIAYLDALTQKTLAQARYKETVYDYEIGKSIYYYYAGKDPKEFIR